MPSPTGATTVTYWSPSAPRRWTVSSQPPDADRTSHSWLAQVSGRILLADRVRLDLAGQPPALVDVTPATVAELSPPGPRGMAHH